MEQSRPAKLPFIAQHMYFYVHVNTRANNSQCEWIYFTHAGKNRPPHDRNHWHNSQLPRLCINLTTNSNVSLCYCRNILHKCEKWMEIRCVGGVRTGRFDHESELPDALFVCGFSGNSSVKGRENQSFSPASWTVNSGGSQGRSWRKPVQRCCFFLLCWLKRVYCPCWP